MPKHRGFFAALFDFSFTDLLTTKVIRFLYIVSIIAVAISAVVFIIGGFEVSSAMGLLILVLSTILFLLSVILVRVYLELIIVMFRIAEHVRDISNKLDR
jgi:uncharacterized membrane protein